MDFLRNLSQLIFYLTYLSNFLRLVLHMHKEQLYLFSRTLSILLLFHGSRGTWTPTGLLPTDFKSGASLITRCSWYTIRQKGAPYHGGHLPKSVLRNPAPLPPSIFTCAAPTVCNVAFFNQCRFSKSPENFVWVYQYKTGGIEGGYTSVFGSFNTYPFWPLITVQSPLFWPFSDSSFLPIWHRFIHPSRGDHMTLAIQ